MIKRFLIRSPYLFRIFFGSVGILSLCFVAVLVVFTIWNNTRQRTSEPQISTTPQTQTEINDMNAIIASFSPEEQDFIREEYEQKMQRAKETGDEGWIAVFEKSLKEAIVESLNSPDLPDDPHELLHYYEDKIRKAKKEGAIEEDIAALEQYRDRQIELIDALDEIDWEFQEDRDRFESLRTPQERIAYYENELQEAEEALRLAKEKGDSTGIRFHEIDIEITTQFIEHYNRQIAWIPAEKRIDAMLVKIEKETPQFIATHRHLLYIEVIDGVETIVGVKTPDEIEAQQQDKRLLNTEDNSDLIVDPASSLPDTSIDNVIPLEQDNPLPSSLQTETSFVPPSTMETLAKKQTQFKEWRDRIDTSYIDVLLSRYMSTQEIDKYFPTPQEREQLKSRTTELQKLVVSQVRKLVSDVKGSTADQKRSLARQLVNKNFDKDFAKSILSELEKDVE